MSNSYFAFKQFVVHQDKCAMKVGTDGVLLGAWADVSHTRSILDVGTGTGLIALMLAQRSLARIDALEIDENAVVQARDNFIKSPWSDRVRVEHSDFKSFLADEKYDLIVSNPPYFTDSLKSPDHCRNMARHDSRLNFYDLITKTATLLNAGGHFSLIVPAEAEPVVIEIAVGCDLFPKKRTFVRTTPGAEPKRLLMTFAFGRQGCATDYLVVELARHIYSEEYIRLTKDFYLKM